MERLKSTATSTATNENRRNPAVEAAIVNGERIRKYYLSLSDLNRKTRSLGGRRKKCETEKSKPNS